VAASAKEIEVLFSVQSTGSSSNSKKGASPSVVANSVKPKPKHQGRERLKHFDEQIRAAQNAIEDLDQRIARFHAIVVESETATRDLQNAINSDGGVSLAAFSKGEAKPDEKIVRLVAQAKSSSEAAVAANIALPHTEALLQNAKAQLVALGEQRHQEINRVITALADVDARRYEKAFQEVCRIHDLLVGYSNTMSSNVGDIHLILEPPRILRFALPSLGSADADPFMRHFPSELTIAESSRNWTAVKNRLDSDPECDLNDLLLR
jgi:hypothetical protein